VPLLLCALIPPQAFSSAGGKKLIFGGGSGFAPYEFLDPSGVPKGFDVELVRAMARIKGWDIEIRLMDWPHAIDALRRGEVDVLMGMLYSEERDREFDFSDPHSTLELSLFTRKDALPLFTLDDLKGRKIAVYDRGMPLEILRERKEIKTSVVKNIEGVFSALTRGEVDAALCPKLMGLYWMREAGISGLKSQDSLIFLRQSCFAVRNGDAALLAEINDALEKMKRSGEYYRLGNLLFEGIGREARLDLFYLLAPLPLIVLALFIAVSIFKGRRSIQLKLTLSFLSISIVPLLGIGALTYFNERDIIKDKVTSHLKSIVELQTALLSQWLDQASSDCRFLARDKILIESLLPHFSNLHHADQNVGTVHIRRYLEGLVGGWGYGEALVISPAGRVLFSTCPLYEGLDMAVNPHFRGAMSLPPGEVYIKDIYYSERTKTLSMAFSTRIQASSPNNKFPQDRVIGVLVLRVCVDRTLYPLLRNWQGMGNSGETMLVRRDGERILFLNNTRNFPDTALKLAIPVQPVTGQAEIALKAISGQRGIAESVDYRGISVLAAYSPVFRTHWGLITKQDSREAISEINLLAQRNYFILMAFLLIVSVFAFLISRSITRPIRILDGMTRRVTEGILDVEPQVRQTDEIGRLMESFKVMTRSLRERFTRSEKLSALGKLSSGIAHEIRTPLTSIRVTVQSLEKQLDLDEDQREDFALVKREIDRINENVTRFLDFARPATPTFKFFDLNSLLRETLNLFQPQIKAKGADVQFTTADEMPEIEGDEKLLRQVFLNIILNALEAIPEMGVVAISIRRFEKVGEESGGEKKISLPGTGSGFVEVLIADNGGGILPQDQSYIFDPFFTTKESGTGLGLSIAFSIVEGHHGWIEVENRPDTGTAFKVVIPVRQEKRK
jgi:signal transduction histidine kinase/ABC-type amino acid transport substrate-binding protein